jgi:hypothetical protein
LIDVLNGNGVTALEYYQTSVGLETGYDFAQALNFLKMAAGMRPDPQTRATVLHAEAALLYQIGNDTGAERAIALSKKAFDVPDETTEAQQNNVAYTELFDAFFQAKMNISCSTAETEIKAAKEIIMRNSSLKASLTSAEMRATKAHAGCH